MACSLCPSTRNISYKFRCKYPSLLILSSSIAASIHPSSNTSRFLPTGLASQNTNQIPYFSLRCLPDPQFTNCAPIVPKWLLENRHPHKRTTCYTDGVPSPSANVSQTHSKVRLYATSNEVFRNGIVLLVRDDRPRQSLQVRIGRTRTKEGRPWLISCVLRLAGAHQISQPPIHHPGNEDLL